MQLSEKFRPKNKDDWAGSLRPVNQVIHHVGQVLQGKPVFKLILLMGPPGTGKTSLAYLVAEHYKLNVVELNASDERNSQDIVRIWKTMTTASLTGNNLVLIDEADGLTRAMQEKLIKASGSSLTPCILCGNYDHAIWWRLKDICLVVDFRNPTKDDMTTLIKKIVSKERIILPNSSLTHLVAISANYRSLLNNLELAVVSGDAENLEIERQIGDMVTQVDATLDDNPPERWDGEPKEIIKWMVENSRDIDLVSLADRFLRIQSEEEEYRFWRYAYSLLSMCRSRRSLGKLIFPSSGSSFKKSSRYSGIRTREPRSKKESVEILPITKPQVKSTRESRSHNLEKWI